MKGYLTYLKSQWELNLQNEKFIRRQPDGAKSIHQAIERVNALLARNDRYARRHVFHFSLDPVWNLPDGLKSINISRPTKWGNKFTVSKYGRDGAINRYKKWIMKPEQKQLRREARRELKDKILLCYCAPLKCHGDVLARIANKPRRKNVSSQ